MPIRMNAYPYIRIFYKYLSGREAWQKSDNYFITTCFHWQYSLETKPNFSHVRPTLS